MADRKNPLLSPAQQKAAAMPHPPVPKRCVVTGGTGFVGIRVCEMLVERGAEEVVVFDVVPVDRITAFTPWRHPALKYVAGDICNPDDVEGAVKGADCVWHLAAAVGPFHPKPLYEAVNYRGTLNVIDACKKHGVRKLVLSGTPSSRFEGSLTSRPCIDGLTEAQMPKLPLKEYMQTYAQTKAMAEMAVTAAVSDDFLATTVAPHQVYGPRDNLFLPNILEAAESGKLRVFGKGDNRICFTHVDNYAHALIITERKLYPGSPVLGKFYVSTDGATHPEPKAHCIFWKEINKAVTRMGFQDLESKAHLPFALLYAIALVAEFVGWLSGTVFKLNVFNVFVLTMHRWFDITAAETELEYTPIIPFTEGWDDTIVWFKENWLPRYMSTKRGGLGGLAKGSQAKIDIQAENTATKAGSDRKKDD